MNTKHSLTCPNSIQKFETMYLHLALYSGCIISISSLRDNSVGLISIIKDLFPFVCLKSISLFTEFNLRLVGKPTSSDRHCHLTIDVCRVMRFPNLLKWRATSHNCCFLVCKLALGRYYMVTEPVLLCEISEMKKNPTYAVDIARRFFSLRRK